VTFRTRTALAVLALTAGTMGGAFFLVWSTFVASQRRQLDAALLEVAEREATEARNGALGLTDAPGPSANAVGPLPKYGVIYGDSGEVLSTTENFRSVPKLSPHMVRAPFDFEHDGHPMRGVTLEVSPSGPARTLLLATTRDDLEDDGRILAQGMALAWLVGCVWAAGVAFGVASRLTRRHAEVVRVARSVASGDTSSRVRFDAEDDDLRQLGDDLNAMIERLVGLVAARDLFVSHAAHELRTPLAALRLEIELAARTARTVEEYEVALSGALGSVERLARLSDDLLALAREPETTTCDVLHAVEDAIRDVRAIAAQKEVAIALDGRAAEVRGSLGDVSRVFRNVLENAVRHSPNGATVKVRVCAEGEGPVEVHFDDEGAGVAPEDVRRIFEPFVRGPGGVVGDGAGLGLAISQRLARRFGGDVRAEADGHGRFVVTLGRG
jgi:two-component system OmpR family sensor kinase